MVGPLEGQRGEVGRGARGPEGEARGGLSGLCRSEEGLRRGRGCAHADAAGDLRQAHGLLYRARPQGGGHPSGVRREAGGGPEARYRPVRADDSRVGGVPPGLWPHLREQRLDAGRRGRGLRIQRVRELRICRRHRPHAALRRRQRRGPGGHDLRAAPQPLHPHRPGQRRAEARFAQAGCREGRGRP